MPDIRRIISYLSNCQNLKLLILTGILENSGKKALSFFVVIEIVTISWRFIFSLIQLFLLDNFI